MIILYFQFILPPPRNKNDMTLMQVQGVRSPLSMKTFQLLDQDPDQMRLSSDPSMSEVGPFGVGWSQWTFHVSGKTCWACDDR